MIYYRRSKREDIEKISPLIAAFRVELKRLKGIQSTFNLKQASEEYTEYMDSNYPIFVAENQVQDLVGYLVCKVDREVVWVESIYVAENYRRQKIASKLYDLAERYAKELGNETLYNWVHPNNDQMIRFLSKKGYNVLNLIELRKPYKDEELTQKIEVLNNDFNY